MRTRIVLALAVGIVTTVLAAPAAAQTKNPISLLAGGGVVHSHGDTGLVVSGGVDIPVRTRTGMSVDAIAGAALVYLSEPRIAAGGGLRLMFDVSGRKLKPFVQGLIGFASGHLGVAPGGGVILAATDRIDYVVQCDLVRISHDEGSRVGVRVNFGIKRRLGQ